MDDTFFSANKKERNKYIGINMVNVHIQRRSEECTNFYFILVKCLIYRNVILKKCFNVARYATVV